MIQVITEHLDAQVGTHAGDQFVETHLDRLGEFVVVAGQFFQCRFHVGHQIGFQPCRVRPFAARFQDHEIVRHVRRHRVGGHFRRADLGEHLVHLRERLDALLQQRLHGHGLLKAGAGNAHGMQGDIAFVQLRDELGAEGAQQPAARQHQQERGGDHCMAQPQRPCQQRPIHRFAGADDRAFLFADGAGHEGGHSGGHQRERQQHGGQQRHHHGGGHRMEHFSFHAGKRKDRDVHHGDNRDTEQAGPDHLGGGLEHALQPFAQRQGALVLRLRQSPDAVFDDDHRTVDDQAEIQCAEAHQVGGDAGFHHAEQRRHHGQRDHRCGDQRSAEIAQQQEQYGDHQQCAFEQVFLHCDDGFIHQRGAVIDRFYLHARWQ